MPLLLTNPLGLWALLGIPAVILIHFLQRQSQILPASTLFLLDAIDRQSTQGRKIDRLRNSLPLWLQILGVLILTWLLIEPRWDRSTTVQRIVIVLDSSASMQAFREESVSALRDELPALFSPRNEVSLTLIESENDGAALYRGDSLSELLATVESHAPTGGAHSSEAALQIGRSLAGTDGTLIFLTDHDAEPDYGALLLSVGEPINNVGFTGHRIEIREEETTWEVTVMNHGTTAQTRQWTLQVGTQSTEPKALTLAPGELRTLAGKFPAAGSRVLLRLDPDDFRQDDERFLIIPSPKPISTAHTVEPEVEPLVTDLLASLPNVPLSPPPSENDETAGTPDLVFATYNPLQPRDFPAQAIVFLHQESVPREFFSGPVTAGNHRLMEGLNWQGLIARKTPSIPPAPADEVLLWQGERPLIILRLLADRRQLLFNFDVMHSNAARLPAFIVLIHRFVDLLRSEKIAPASDNFDLHQPIPLAVATDPGAPRIEVTEQTGTTATSPSHSALLRAPRNPGFFSFSQGDTPLLSGAANFADTREADFSKASARSELSASSRQILEHHTVSDPWWSLWGIALLLLSIVTWTLLSRPQAEAPSVSSATS